MRIQHNIMAMNAYRNYNTNTSALSKNLEKLSSGYKINRAGDDAAGLAISEKMRAQITGLNAAQKNVKDGISLVKTAEGAMQEIHDMLNRMDYLATQSANGTYDDPVDRLNLQKEVDALRAEINRIADSANFNGINLLDGTAASESISALGEMDTDAMINGTTADPAGKAQITVQMSGGVGAVETSLVVDDDKTVENKADPTAATSATVELKFDDDANWQGATVGNEATTLAELAVKIAGGKTLDQLFKVQVGGADKDWTTDAAEDLKGKTVTLTAINRGELSASQISDLNDLLDETGITKADSSVTNGANEGGGASATEYKHELTIDLSKLVGGQTLEVYGKKIAITTDGTTTPPTGFDAVIDLNALNPGEDDTAGATATGVSNVATAIQAAFDTALNGTVFTVADYDVGDIDTTDPDALKYKVTLTANANSGYDGNLGEVRMATAEGAVGDIVNVNTTNYVPATPAQGGAYASITYKDFDINALGVGDKVTIGGKTVEVVENDDARLTADGLKVNGNTIYLKLDNAKDATKLASAFQAGGYTAGRIQIDAGNNELKITAANSSTTAAALKTDTAAKVTKAPTSQVATATGGQAITAGTTTWADLMDKEIDGDKTVGDLFEIKINDTEVTDANKSTTFAANSKIELIAKTPGKIADAVMAKVTYGGDASSTVVRGWDEGTSGVSANTHYELVIDPTNIAGGNTFSFGNVSGTSKTFELSLDDAPTGNGTINTDPKAEVAGTGSRTQINVGGLDADEIASAIETAVDGAMDGFTAKATVVDGKIKLTVDADTASDSTNLGNIRFSSESGAFSDAVYNPYNAASGGTEGTYAQVSYDFDINNLAEGDKLTIGDITVTVGEKTETVKDEDGNFHATLSAEDAKNATKLIAAFESSGYKSGQISIAGGKLTITGTEAGQAAEELADGAAKVSLTSTTRALTKGGLTLQIGDTADTFNQLTVSVGDMHTDAMGTKNGGTIANINVSTQEGAQGAIQVIKDAINYVSSVRGDLGAVQNRLEHTANNLSVMTENIQDAESTIRDTDVAEEMMAYTKNNILIQSAQAMLAQANAVPQGVLQLLG